ncbi:hypothetical protein PG995_011607 [Apiospora arundinis]
MLPAWGKGFDQTPSALPSDSLRESKSDSDRGTSRLCCAELCLGKTPHLPDELGAEPRYPATIQDAIQVTMQLGFEYLWVDRYCINQTSIHKTAQIQQMGQIYYQASLTIFAAAGPDPSYGLPGVSRARLLPDTVVHHPYTITPIPDKPQRYIQQSIWATRGWTYQEAYLSRRRLFFTDVQLYFECATAPREELSFYQGLNSAPSDDCLFPRPDLNLLDKKTLFGCIVDYSRREFGFIGDRLRGFLGILAVFATRIMEFKEHTSLFWVSLDLHRLIEAQIFQVGLGLDGQVKH